MQTHNHDKTYPRGLNSTKAEAVAGIDTTKIIDAASMKQAFSSWLRDSVGKFQGTVQPSLNLFCPDYTTDVAPIGTFTRASSTTRLGPTGLIETVATDGLAREWDADGNLLGWLIQESRTNLQTNSENFGSWTLGAATVTANAIAGPDGNVTADKLCENNTNAQHSATGIVCTAGSVAVTKSVFAKLGERTSLGMLISDNTSAVISASFDLTTGIAAVTASPAPWSVVSASMKYYGNGWYRCILTATKGQGTTCTGVLNPLVGGVNSYTGTTGSGLYLWGAQLEIGSFPTSYIPTTSAAVTRAADVWTALTSAFGFNANEGTIYTDCDFSAVPSGTTNYITAALNDTTTSNMVYVAGWSISGKVSLLAAVGGTYPAQAVGGQSNIVPGTRYRSFSAYKLNDYSQSVNGAAVATDTVAGVPPMTRLDIGSICGTNFLNGHIFHIAYFPRRLSGTILQAITL